METLSIKVSKSDKLRLQRIAKERKLTLSAVLREGLEHSINHQKTTQGTSCYDLAEGILEDETAIGASGVGDLSSNKAHLESFGR